jgi:uncharacterized protein involved in type VI secretion and phage assembly
MKCTRRPSLIALPTKMYVDQDRYGKQNEQSSCWIRVSQSLAGPQFGTQFLPRVGMEVVVSHLDDDPNRPLVTGVVYRSASVGVRERAALQSRITNSFSSASPASARAR